MSIQEKNGKDGERDKARASKKSPLLTRTGEALADGARSIAEAGRRAGYAENTLRNASANGVPPDRALVAYTESSLSRKDPTLHGTLAPLASRVLAEALQDESTPAGTRATIAGAVLKLSLDRPQESKPNQYAPILQDRLQASLARLASFAAGLRRGIVDPVAGAELFAQVADCMNEIRIKLTLLDAQQGTATDSRRQLH